MQRVREQQQSRGERGGFRAEHGGLASAVGVAAEINSAGNELSQGCRRTVEALAVVGGIAGAGRAEGAILAEGQIAPEHSQTRGREGGGEGEQERRLAIGSRAVGEDHARACGSFRPVEKSPHRRIHTRISETLDLRLVHVDCPRRPALLGIFELRSRPNPLNNDTRLRVMESFSETHRQRHCGDIPTWSQWLGDDHAHVATAVAKVQRKRASSESQPGVVRLERGRAEHGRADLARRLW